MTRLTPAIIRMMRLGRTPQAAMVMILQRVRAGDACHIAQAEFARCLSVDERTVRRALTSLEDVGLISRERRMDRRGYRSTDRIVVHHDAWSVTPNKRHPTGQNVRLANRSECPVGLPDKMSAPIEVITNTQRETTIFSRQEGDVGGVGATTLPAANEGPSLTVLPGGRAA